MKKLALTLACLLVLTQNVGCIHKMVAAAFPQKGKNQDSVKKVKTAAVVAFDAMTYIPQGLAAKVIPGAGALNTVAGFVPVETELPKELYFELQKQLNEQGIRTLSFEKIAANPIYINLYKERSGRLAEKQLRSQQPNVIHGFLRPANATHLLTLEQIQELKKALKVDALVMARVSFGTTRGNSISIGGIGSSLHLDSVVSFYMFDGSQEAPIWFDNGFAGPQSEESVGHMAGNEDMEIIGKLNQPMGEKGIQAFFRSE